MDIQNKFCFNSNQYQGTELYLSYNTPPYSYCSCELQTDNVVTNFKQMQQPIRFPTPPITPPRLAANTQYVREEELYASRRTESVIMKVEQDSTNGREHIVRAGLYTVDEQCLNSDSRSSSSGSPVSDFFCNWINCGRYFENLDGLAQHVTQQHAIASTADGLYYCRWNNCLRTERGFNARYKMLVHVRTHTKEKPHSCHLCDKSFSRAENLKIHVRSHSGEKPYKCPHAGCQKAYSNSSDRFKHTRTHTNEKPYICKVPGCQKRYTDPSSLRKHVKTFKHTEQILINENSAQTTTVIKYSTENATSQNKYAAYQQHYLPVTTGADVPQYYIDASNTYQNIEYVPQYWVPTPEHNLKSQFENAADLTMEVDTDVPLDLSICRR